MHKTAPTVVAILAGAALFAGFAWVFPTASIDPFVVKSLAQDSGGVRNVTPSGVTPGPPNDGLTRVPGIEPPPDPPKWRRFFQPVASTAGAFELGATTIRLEGIQPTDPERQCRDGDESWPCGRSALTALRAMLRGRAIECYWAKEDEAPPAEAPCRVGAQDLSLWLAGAGWAEISEGASQRLRDAAQQARCAGLGIWRGTRGESRCGSSAGSAARSAD